nr:hypothetical protein [Tanacetum cinerariifolium]
MDDPNITIEEYMRLEEEKARRKCLLIDNKIDFRISFDKSDDEDYTVIYDEHAFSYKIISVNNLKMDSENDDDKVNMPSFPSPEPEQWDVIYLPNQEFVCAIWHPVRPQVVYKDGEKQKQKDLSETMICRLVMRWGMTRVVVLSGEDDMVSRMMMVWFDGVVEMTWCGGGSC